MIILFLHAWQSVPGGVKPTYLAQYGHEVINSALPDRSFDESVAVAQAEFEKPDVVVGSIQGVRGSASSAFTSTIRRGSKPILIRKR
jgi:hypothetical protein